MDVAVITNRRDHDHVLRDPGRRLRDSAPDRLEAEGDRAEKRGRAARGAVEEPEQATA